MVVAGVARWLRLSGERRRAGHGTGRAAGNGLQKVPTIQIGFWIVVLPVRHRFTHSARQ